MTDTQTMHSPSTARWQSMVMKPSMRPEPDQHWSTMQDIMTLLKFDGPANELDDAPLFARRRLKANQPLFHMGQSFDGLYVVRLGALKSTMTHTDGGEHVLAFPMKGDLLGFDGVCKNQYLSDVVALTDCDLIKIPTLEFFSPGRGCNDIERIAYWAISREIVQEQSAYSLSHLAKSEARVARFLRIQSGRFAAMGYSPKRFTLPMSRRDIGNYLGITMETVSRAFSALDQLGIISVLRRDIEIHSMDALREYED